MSGESLKPWRILKSDTVYACPPYLSVESQRVALPDGREIEPYFRINLRSWVVMIAVTEDRNVVIGRQYRHGYERISLMLPGGLLEPGEDYLVAAKRELLEETGYASDEWEDLGRYVPNSSYRCGEAHLFLAKSAKKVAEPESDDLEETEWLLLPLDQLVKDLGNGDVISMSTVAALCMAALRLPKWVSSNAKV